MNNDGMAAANDDLAELPLPSSSASSAAIPCIPLDFNNKKNLFLASLIIHLIPIIKAANNNPRYNKMMMMMMMVQQEVVLLLVLAMAFHTTGYTTIHYHHSPPSRLSRTISLLTPSRLVDIRSSLSLKREAVEEEQSEEDEGGGGRLTRIFSSSTTTTSSSSSSMPRGSSSGSHSRPMGESLEVIEEVEEEEEAEKKNAYKLVLPVLALTALGGIFAFTHHLDLSTLLDQVVERIAELGPYGYLLFAVVYVIAEILAVPAIPLTASSGYLFGLVPGTAIVLSHRVIHSERESFISATFLGFAPGSFGFVYFGSAGKSLFSGGAGLPWYAYGAIGLLLALFVQTIARVATDAVKHMEVEDDHNNNNNNVTVATSTLPTDGNTSSSSSSSSSSSLFF
eukprot:scaffold562_cov190-Ochromonas_danica.AAC.1